MRVESVYTTSYVIGGGPQAKTEIHTKKVDEKGWASYTVEEHPYVSYSSKGQLETIKVLGSNLDNMA